MRNLSPARHSIEASMGDLARAYAERNPAENAFDIPRCAKLVEQLMEKHGLSSFENLKWGIDLPGNTADRMLFMFSMEIGPSLVTCLEDKKSGRMVFIGVSAREGGEFAHACIRVVNTEPNAELIGIEVKQVYSGDDMCILSESASLTEVLVKEHRDDFESEHEYQENGNRRGSDVMAMLFRYRRGITSDSEVEAYHRIFRRMHRKPPSPMNPTGFFRNFQLGATSLLAGNQQVTIVDNDMIPPQIRNARYSWEEIPVTEDVGSQKFSLMAIENLTAGCSLMPVDLDKQKSFRE